MKGRKTKNRSLLEVLRDGPSGHYGNKSEEETQCCDSAKKILLEAKEPLSYREELLKALIDFEAAVAGDAAAFSAAGESC